MKIVTWNVNSIRARLDRVVAWLKVHRPDVVCLQETKVADEHFPRAALEDEGYNVEPFGTPTYNGVAILASHTIEDVVRGLPDGMPGDDRRVLAGIVRDVIVVSVYAPNGKHPGHPDYERKLAWYRRLRAMLDARYPRDEKLVVCGDFNVTFDDRDVWDPVRWHEAILCSTPERHALRHLMGWGLHDALRKHREEGGIYTWWDYRAGSAQRDHGLRIDHFLVSERALEGCAAVAVDRQERLGPGSSDHAPVTAVFGPAGP
jgi:exodeoxyribonuclease-3